MSIEETVLNLIEQPLLAEGLRVDEVLFLKEDNNYFLRIIIDKEGFVDLNTCIKATKIINPLLDDDLTDKAYILDITSKEKGE